MTEQRTVTASLYRGWTVTDNGENYHPKTGRFRAMRFGVGMGHSTLEGLKRMIDTKETEGQSAHRET